jgi:hypothetical protein
VTTADRLAVAGRSEAAVRTSHCCLPPTMDPEAVATLSAITGLPAAEAEGFLEMGQCVVLVSPRRRRRCCCLLRMLAYARRGMLAWVAACVRPPHLGPEPGCWRGAPVALPISSRCLQRSHLTSPPPPSPCLFLPAACLPRRGWA